MRYKFSLVFMAPLLVLKLGRGFTKTLNNCL